jgi:hypothetical protein
LTAVLGVSSAAEVAVANLSRINGTAYVSKGAGYVVGREGMPLRDGDRVFPLKGGSLVVQYKDGCRVEASDEEILRINAETACVVAGQTAAATTVGAGVPNWAPIAAGAAFIGIVALASDGGDGGGGGGGSGQVFPPLPPISP